MGENREGAYEKTRPELPSAWTPLAQRPGALEAQSVREMVTPPHVKMHKLTWLYLVCGVETTLIISNSVINRTGQELGVVWTNGPVSVILS